MTAPVPEVAGPACDICQQEPAQASLMFLADYSQVKFGMGCAAEFLRAQADAVDQAVAAVPETPVIDGSHDLTGLTLDDAAFIQSGATIAADSTVTLPSGITIGSARWQEAGGVVVPAAPRPDPLTANVVKSTHGHRRAAAQESAGVTPSGSESG